MLCHTGHKLYAQSGQPRQMKFREATMTRELSENSSAVLVPGVFSSSSSCFTEVLLL